MNLDSRIKLAKEGRLVGSPFGVDDPVCHRCGARAMVYGAERNGDPVTDHRCSRCNNDAVFTAMRAHQEVPQPIPAAPAVCKFCYKAPPLLGIWCGPCAIRHNENAIANNWAPKEEAEARIAYFRSLMDGTYRRPGAGPEKIDLEQEAEMLNAYDPTQEE